MKSLTTLTNLFTNLSNNTSTANQQLGQQLISDQHRLLIEKYFDNERSYSTVTIGSQTLTTTASLSSGATSATLTAAWPNQSVRQQVNFSNGNLRTVQFIQGSTSISWTPALTSSATTSLSCLGVQSYPIPATVSKIKNSTITVGQLKYTPAPVMTIDEWTKLNALPYSSNIPNYYFIYHNAVHFFPIPSSSGNLITFTYQARVPDLSFSDYTTGTLTGLTAGANAITGSSTSWNTTGLYPLNTDLSAFNLALKIAPPSGEGIWYPIYNFTSDTALNLQTPLQNVPSSTASSYTIGQLPLLQEDFHDMLVYGALKIYYSAINENADKYKLFSTEYEIREKLLERYAANKVVNVDLGQGLTPRNPNLYIYN